GRAGLPEAPPSPGNKGNGIFWRTAKALLKGSEEIVSCSAGHAGASSQVQEERARR
nr:hypothetical protein [Tanacetum cinerariifolium]